MFLSFQRPTMFSRNSVLFSILTLFVFVLSAQADADEISLFDVTQRHLPDQQKQYKKVGDRTLKLNIFTPKNYDPDKKTYPAIVLFHGGGWEGGDRQLLAPHARYWAERGLVAVNVEYRLVDQNAGVGIMDTMRDCRDALQYVYGTADRLGIDRSSIALLGESAGGHLAASMVLKPSSDPFRPLPFQPAALVLYNPVLDLPALHWMSAKHAAVPSSDSLEGESWKERAQMISPIEHVQKNLPPTLLVHGKKDNVVPQDQIQRFTEKMREAGNEVTLHLKEGWQHAFALRRYKTPMFETMKMTDRFLNSRGIVQGKPPLTRWEPNAYKKRFTDEERKQRHVAGTSYDLKKWPFLDGQWEGSLYASDGNVYFSVSTHDKTKHAQVFRFLPDEKKIEHLADLGKVTGHTDLDVPTQDKIHSRMFESGKYIYCGTTGGHATYKIPHPGGYWIRINKKTGNVKSLGRSVTRDGLITVGYDRKRNLLYGHTNQDGLFSVFDPETTNERILGFPWHGSDKEWPRALTLMVPPGHGGTVYGFRPPHSSVWEYDPATGKIRTLDVTMPVPDDVKNGGDEIQKEWRNHAGMMTRWNEEDQCIYFIRSFDGALCKFVPPSDDGTEAKLEVVHDDMRPDIPRRYGNRHPACTLVIHDRTAYYTPYTGWGGEAHLTSYDLDSGEFTHHGPIVVEKGRRVNESQSMSVGPDGKLYIVAFVFSIKGEDPVRKNAMRGKYPFHPRLVVVDPEEDTRKE